MRSTGSRAASTAATRRAIINAARHLLATRDWGDFTLDAVAATAGVTRVTVYNQVRSKHGLLDAVLTDLTERAGMDQLLIAVQAMTATAARAFIVERTCQFWHAERAVLRPLFGLAAVDRDIAANLAQRERWRSDQLARLLERLVVEGSVEEGSVEQGSVGRRLPRELALAGMLMVTSFPAYDSLGRVGDDPARAATLVLHLMTGVTG